MSKDDFRRPEDIVKQYRAFRLDNVAVQLLIIPKGKITTIGHKQKTNVWKAKLSYRDGFHQKTTTVECAGYYMSDGIRIPDIIKSKDTKGEYYREGFVVVGGYKYNFVWMRDCLGAYHLRQKLHKPFL